MNIHSTARRIANKSSLFLQLAFISISAVTSAFAQVPKIQITEPLLPEAQDAVKIAFKVSGASQKRIRVTVAAGGSAVTSDEIRFAADGEHVINVNLFKGDNTITLVGFVNDEPVNNLIAPLRVKCNGRWCKELFSLKPDTVASEFKEGGGSGGPGQGTGTQSGQGGPKPPETTAQKGDVHINKPTKDVHYVDAATVPLTVAVDRKSDPAKNVKTVFVTVLSNGQPVIQKENPVQITYPSDPKKPGELATTIKIGKGTNNRIIVFDPTQPDAQRDEVQIICEGDKCGGGVATAQTTQGIKIDSPEGGAQLQDAQYVLSKITVKKDSNVTKVFVRVLNNGKPLEKPVVGDGESLDVTFEAGKTEAVLKPKIRVGEGTNVITVFDAAKSIDEGPQDSTEVNCTGEKCGAVVAPHTGAVVIDQLKDVKFQDASFIKSKVRVSKKSISKLFVRVLNGGKPVEQRQDSWAVKFKEGETVAEVKPTVRIAEGTNEITVLSDPLTDESDQDSTTVVCEGADCGSENEVSTIVTNSLNTRVVVGLEQAGASSANSETKPFLDFFFTGPLRFSAKNSELPRLSTWGQIRISTTPEQVGAVGVFPSNLVNQVSQTGKTVGLVQSFDFLAGLEGRVFGSNRYFLSLVPGVKQRTEFYVIAGGGAISPLSTTQQTAQIFTVPGTDNPQRQLFIKRFGPEAAAKTYIGFVFPERDRFLRQYYGGIRLKTFYYDRDERLINRFPAILDFMVGQNEAVTGGKLKNDVTDSSGKILGQKRSWVLRIDGFYPLPIKEASFIYLYGTAIMKVGGGGVRISTPLFLDTAPGNILLTSNDVFIAPNLQMNRDYYKIGVGVNLTDLFNRKKPAQ